MAGGAAEAWRHVDPGTCSFSSRVYIIANRPIAHYLGNLKLTSHCDSTDTSGNPSHHVSLCRDLPSSRSRDDWHPLSRGLIPNFGVSQFNVSQVKVSLRGSDSGCTLVRLDPCEEFFPGFLACTLQVSLRLIVSTGTRSKPQSITDIRC